MNAAGRPSPLAVLSAPRFPLYIPAVDRTYLSCSPDILVVRFSSIGDILLTTPLLRAIRTKWPGARVTVLTKRQYVPLVSDNPNVTEVFGIAPQRHGPQRRAARSGRVPLHPHARPAGRPPDPAAPAARARALVRLSQPPGGAGAAHPLSSATATASTCRCRSATSRPRPTSASSPTAARRSSS